MITRIAILNLLLLSFFCQGQSSSLGEELELTIQNSIFSDKIDRDYIDLIIEIDHGYVSRNLKEISARVHPVEHRNLHYINKIRSLMTSRTRESRAEKLSFLDTFYSTLQGKKSKVTMSTLMQKPSFNDLLAIYLTGTLTYSKRDKSLDGGQSIYRNDTSLEEETIIQAIEGLVSEEQLIRWYYYIVFSNLDDVRIHNVNLDNIGLNHKEQSIVYYKIVNRHAISIIGICEYGKKSKVEKVLNQIPNINNKHFTKFKPYIYEDEVKMELYNKVIQCYEAIQKE